MKVIYLCFIVLTIACFPNKTQAQKIDSVVEKQNNGNRVISLKLYRDTVSTRLPLTFNVVYNYIDPTTAFQKVAVDMFYTLQPGVQELTVYYTVPKRSHSPFLNIWATTKSYYGLPIVIGKVPVIGSQDISKK